MDELIVDRRRKDERKQLSAYLLNHALIPVIDGNFLAASSLKRSLIAFLNHLRRSTETNIYFVGASATIFNELWQEAGPLAAAPSPPMNRADVLQMDLTEVSARLNRLLEVNDPAAMARLRRLYIGDALQVEMLRSLIVVAARSDVPVLILGETGTGKELVANGIHEFGRRTGPLKAINCGGFPAELFESELFGHVKGAFTGAMRDKEGLWQAAQGGTLFLDEIGDLGPAHQVKILRALQEGTVRRVGDTADAPVNARIVAATNRDLWSMVEAGLFREDLYFRICQLTLHTPALRDHREDIPALAQVLWKKIAGPDSPALPADMAAELESFPWPGNVRELKSILATLHAMFGADRLDIDRLLLLMRLQGRHTPRESALSGGEAGLHQIECLRHLRRAVESIRACKVAVRQVLHPAAKLSRAALRAISDSLCTHLVQLEQLCLRPEFFVTHATFEAVVGFKGRLFAFNEQLLKTPHQARDQWKAELDSTYDSALAAAMTELQRLLQRT